MKEKLKQRKTLFIVISIILVIVIIAGVTTVILINQNKNQNEAKIETETARSETNTETTNTIGGQTTKANVENDAEVEKIMQLDASGDKVPVPEGYVGSKATGENEIDTGYVIYEGTEEVNDSNVAEAKKTRNQYVWVPVPDITKFYGTDETGKRWGKLYSFATSSSNANYDEVTGTYPNNWSETNGVMRISSTNSNREPDVLTSRDTASGLKTANVGVESMQEFLMQLEKEFYVMTKSVEKYGGFYIGRYETGNLSQDVPVVQQGNTDISSQTWYTMYNKCKKLRGDNMKVTTGMIWGCQWDRTLMWLAETGSKTKEEIASDSTSWGNYSNSTFEYINSSGSTITKIQGFKTRIPTGSAEYTKANNIYDLAGNARDMTMETIYNSNRVCRGGYYSKNFGDSASYRDSGYSPTSSSDSLGVRSTLYIK